MSKEKPVTVAVVDAKAMPSSFEEMVTALKKSGELIVEELTPDAADLLHMAAGISGEVGEYFTAANLGDRGNALEELGDTEFYLEGILQNLRDNYDDPIDVPVLPARYDIIAMGIESAEILDLAKKVAIYCRDLDVPKMVAHIGNLRCLLDGCYAVHQSSRAEAVASNMDKLLKKRYPNGEYSNEAANARADKQ